VRVGSVGGNSNIFQAVDGLQAVQAFGDEDEIRTENGNLFQARIDGVTDFSLFLSVGRVIAVLGVADEMILQSKCVDGFGQAGGERHDTVDRLGNANSAAGFIGDFPVDGGCGRNCRSALRARYSRAGQQSSDCGGDSGSERYWKILSQIFPNPRITLCQQKSPTRHFGACGMALSREERGLCGTGGWPGLRLFSRLQWRDRGRFTRPSPLPLLQIEFRV